jgi:hypothetical protein
MPMQNSCLLCIVNYIPEISVSIVLQARVLDVLLKGCDRVINHVEEVSSALSTLLPSTYEFSSFGRIINTLHQQMFSFSVVESSQEMLLVTHH